MQIDTPLLLYGEKLFTELEMAQHMDANQCGRQQIPQAAHQTPALDASLDRRWRNSEFAKQFAYHAAFVLGGDAQAAETSLLNAVPMGTTEPLRKLEIGCGGGKLLPDLAGTIDFVVGIDLSARQLQLAEEYLRTSAPQTRARIKLFQGDVRVRDLLGHNLDVIIAKKVLHEISRFEQQEVLNNARHALGSDGVLLLWVDSAAEFEPQSAAGIESCDAVAGASTLDELAQIDFPQGEEGVVSFCRAWIKFKDLVVGNSYEAQLRYFPTVCEVESLLRSAGFMQIERVSARPGIDTVHGSYRLSPVKSVLPQIKELDLPGFVGLQKFTRHHLFAENNTTTPLGRALQASILHNTDHPHVDSVEFSFRFDVLSCRV